MAHQTNRVGMSETRGHEECSFLLKMARPSTYDPKLSEKVDEYLESCGSNNLKLPQVADFARFIGISRDTAYEWASKHPEFSDTIKKIKDYQRIDLINNGLYSSKEVSATMAIFLLKVNHGMIETERKQLVGENNGPVEIRIVEDDENRITDKKLSETAVDL